MQDKHIPVLLHQALLYLAVQPNYWYVDATVGGGGYTKAILEKGGNVIGIDTDEGALKAAKERLGVELPEKREGEHYRFVHDSFEHIDTIVEKQNIPISGVVFDLGFSSIQLDDTKRGLSYRFPDAPLDFRLDRSKGIPTNEYLKSLTEEVLSEILSRYGEEPRSKAISRVIVEERKKRDLLTVGAFTEVVKRVVPEGAQFSTLSRVFQAIRIAQNDEMNALKNALAQTIRILPKTGRIIVVSFHSLEDRIVKLAFRSPELSEITKKPVMADDDERRMNPRARSAKLRAVEKV